MHQQQQQQRHWSTHSYKLYVQFGKKITPYKTKQNCKHCKHIADTVNTVTNNVNTATQELYTNCLPWSHMPRGNEWAQSLRRIKKPGALQREQSCRTEKPCKNSAQCLGALHCWTRLRQLSFLPLADRN